MARSMIDKIIYSITKKPKHYVEVKNPPKTVREKLAHPQHARQVQFNRWSKSSGQTIRSEWHGQPHHYHWLDFWIKPFVNSKHRKFKEREFSGERVYYNKYGQLTHQGDAEHHIYGDKKDI